jgi:hypothetical protein
MRKVGEKRNYFSTPEFPAKDHLSACIRAVNLKDVLGNVQSDDRDLHEWLSSGCWRCG